MTDMGLREQIKAASVRKPLKVHVKEWNLDVFVHGVRIWKDDELGEVSELDGAVMGELFDVAQKHNKITEADVVELAGEL